MNKKNETTNATSKRYEAPEMKVSIIERNVFCELSGEANGTEKQIPYAGSNQG